MTESINSRILVGWGGVGCINLTSSGTGFKNITTSLFGNSQEAGTKMANYSLYGKKAPICYTSQEDGHLKKMLDVPLEGRLIYSTVL